MYYEIKTKRLLLRPLCMNDFETTHIYTTNKDLTRYMMFLPHTTEEETKNFLKNATANWQQKTHANTNLQLHFMANTSVEFR